MAEGAFELLEEKGAEAPGEDVEGQQEAGPAGDPEIALRGETTAGDDAVEVGMEGETRALGVEDGDLGRDREDDVVVLAIEEFAVGALEPLGVGGPLALGAVTVATGLVAETAVPAMVALLHLPAESDRAAALEEGLSVAP